MANASGGFIRTWLARGLTWAIAATAVAFVVWVVPIRDRCEAPAGGGEMLPLSITPSGCVLDSAAGPISLDSVECRALRCEPGLMSTFEQADLLLLALMAVAYGLGTLAWAVRWHQLLRLARAPLSVLGVWRVTVEAQAAGIVLPGGVGGDALRVAYVVGMGGSLSVTTASVLLDRAIGLVTLSSVAALLGVATSMRFDSATLAFSILPVAFLLSFAALRHEWLVRSLARIPLAQGICRALEYLAQPDATKSVARGFAASAVVSVVQLAVVRGLVAALGVTPQEERWVYVGTAISFVVSAFPAVPGGWGTSDAAFVFFLGRAGIPAPTALAVSLIYRMFWYATGTVGGVLRLLRPEQTASPSNT